MEVKKCSCCKRKLSFDNFYKDRNRLRTSCKNCYKRYWERQGFGARLLRDYKISLDERNQMLKWQDSKCAICGVRENGKKLHIDHNHNTGQLRMLLCVNCNRNVCVLESKLYQSTLEYLKTYYT